jgi:hypothetical protein
MSSEQDRIDMSTSRRAEHPNPSQRLELARPRLLVIWQWLSHIVIA